MQKHDKGLKPVTCKLPAHPTVMLSSAPAAVLRSIPEGGRLPFRSSYQYWNPLLARSLKAVEARLGDLGV